MSYSLAWSRRFVRRRLPLVAVCALAFSACDNSSAFNTESTGDPAMTDGGVLADGSTADAPGDVAASTTALSTDATLASATFSGGIPLGFFAQPITALGSRYNGAGNLHGSPSGLKSAVAAVKSRGGKAILELTGGPKSYLNPDGTFSLTKWKAIIYSYRNSGIGAYIQDGTIVGNLMIDEPNDPSNWAGKPVPGSTLEQMAQYQKQIFPGLTAIVRTRPSYLKPWAPYRYVDAAWAQYLYRLGNPTDFLNKNVADAKALGLALVVGLNNLKGGPNGSAMTAAQVKSWGGTLLGSTYPCAFVSWKWTDGWISGSGIGTTMDYLRSKAQSRPLKSCKAG